MSIFDKYKDFHQWGTQFIVVEAHMGMGFFFPTVAGLWGLAPLLVVFGLMVAVIAGKEYMDDKTGKGPYSLLDLGSWFVGGWLAVGVQLLRGWV